MLFRSGQVGDAENENSSSVDDDHKPSQPEAAKLERIAEWLRNELGITGAKSAVVPFQQIPMFLGHGVDDPIVRCELGRLAAQFLEHVGIDTRWNEYTGLDHWFSGNMLRDIVLFLDSLEGWEING